jgi:DNA polymerase III delta prime subunit
MAVRHTIVGIGSPRELEEALRAAYYLADEELSTAAYLALALGKPLLLEGAPGVGKTEAAKAIAAKGEEEGGADLIVIYNSGRYRMAGRGSLAGMMPYGDANGVVVEMAREVLPVVARHSGSRRRLRHRSVPPNGCLLGRSLPLGL